MINLKKALLKLWNYLINYDNRNLANGIFERSPQWPALRNRWIKLYPYCSICRSDQNLIVHHKKPVHLWPELELDEKNLMTMCENKWNCHLNIGHIGDFHSYNPRIDEVIKWTIPIWLIMVDVRKNPPKTRDDSLWPPT